jgi:hypothetical protein
MTKRLCAFFLQYLFRKIYDRVDYGEHVMLPSLPRPEVGLPLLEKFPILARLDVEAFRC